MTIRHRYHTHSYILELQRRSEIHEIEVQARWLSYEVLLHNFTHDLQMFRFNHRECHKECQRTCRKSSSAHGPWSTGPSLDPSSSITRLELVVRPAFLESALGASTKQVKWRSVSRLDGTADCPVEAISACMSAKSGVFSRSLARSSGVLSNDR